MKKLLLIVALVALSSADIMSDSLTLHNNERNAYGVPSVTWSADLASSAQAYAEVMASTGTTSHSTNRVNVGENLAWGTGGNINVVFLGNLWIAEKQYYIPGQDFPDVSTTGSWHDVAHYTQLMWELTTQIGCGIAQASSGRYNYVCHYAPQGNIDGEPVYTVGAAAISPSASSSYSPSSSPSSPAPSSSSPSPSYSSPAPSPSSSGNNEEGTLSAEPVITGPFNPVNTEPFNPVNTEPFNPVNAEPFNPVNAEPFNPVNTEPFNPVNTEPFTPVIMEPYNPVNTEPYTPEPYPPVIMETYNPVGTEPYTPVGTEPYTPVGTEPYTPVGTEPYTPVGTEPYTPVSTEPYTPVNTAPPVATAPVITQPVTSTPVASTPVATAPVTSTPVATAPTTTTTAPATTSSSSGTTGPSPSQPYTYSTSAPDASSSSFIPDCLYAHNHERNNYGIPSLTWSTSLAQTAQSYSQVMASTGSTSHSTGRVNVGENLAWQSGYGTNVEALANRWLNEKQYYIAGQDFPNVSTTGNWESVAHYTQMMWRKTTQVGCGVSEGNNGMYYYVCHYSVQGNIMGQPVY